MEDNERKNRGEEKAQINREKLGNLLEKSKLTIFESNSVFPFDLFPDRIAIDANKITVTHNFFLSSNVFPIPIETINGVEVHHGILFGAVRIEIQGFNQNPEIIKFLWNADARRAKRYALALIKCHKEGIDLSDLTQEELVVKLEEIGRQPV
jgi:hypothetical protein